MNMATPFQTILQKFRENAHSESDKGTRFEKLMVRYLQTDPVYKDRFSGVWLWADWEWRAKIADQGIDIVAQEAASGDYVAIQCKCYSEEHTLSLEDVGTFFSTMNMMWNTEQGMVSFTRGIIIATTNKWNDKILKTIDLQQKPCARITLNDLETAGIDWAACAGSADAELQVKPHYTPKRQQQDAIDDVIRGFESHDRGKLVMACGTGKTFTSLRLAEDMTDGKGTVLFMVPSIALLSQALRSWMEQADEPMHAIAVCSDAKASKLDDEDDLTSNNLPAPACTNVDSIANQYSYWKLQGGLIVVFSTYQSIQVVSDAQKRGALPEFDLIICDEAHRTTGVSLKQAKGGYDESQFVRIHHNDHVKGKKRLYMTATPRIYTENSKKKAEEGGALIASMDDETVFGPELHRLPFSKAVREGLLSDYKVLVLCVDEDYVREHFHTFLKENGGEYEIEDMVKLLGCYNGLRKRLLHEVKMARMQAENDEETPYDPSEPVNANPEEEWEFLDKRPMKRAVAFTGKIATSKAVKNALTKMMDTLREMQGTEEDFLECKIDHVDGTMNAQVRNNALSWLKNEAGANECRILTNARCLSEGVDVPSLDAVMFLSPQRSQVDIVQAVGRVMRIAPDKKYGYILLPIGIPRDKKPEDVLGEKGNKYATVWDVLQALRAHDDRFNAEINHIELNKGRKGRMKLLDATGNTSTKDGNGGDGGHGGDGGEELPPLLPDFPLWQDAIFARIVKKCGDRRYWEDWAKDIAKIAERQIETITKLLDDGHGQAEFERFFNGLHASINPAITREQAIEMLAQQVITRPVFDALFDSYRFAEENPVSKTMNAMLQLVHENTSDEDTKSLQKFYESVKERTKGIDNAAGKQKVITELYDKFFKNAFPKMADALGIVYTPVEIVDFIIHSVHHILKTEFGKVKGLGEHGVRILDPFTGTGTFLVRLIQSGLIKAKDLPYKYKNDMFASEIVLLAYYIACVNIEEAYHGAKKESQYVPFEGICLTDTFRMDATGKNLLAEMFSDNANRVKRLVNNDIRVIIANPPYSVGQESANDNNQNEDYPELDERISQTYALTTDATNKRNLYDSYIRAFRWASDRIQDDGVIGFVTNGAFLDNNAMNGFRRTLMAEFSSIYCFNLRGNARTSGLQRQKEKGNVFGEGSRTPVCITLLVKKKDYQGEAKLHYYDIGDYLTREVKLRIVKDFGNINTIPWETPQMDEHGDWLNHRNPVFSNFMTIADKDNRKNEERCCLFKTYTSGLITSRDSWCYNFARAEITRNTSKALDFYNNSATKQEVEYDVKQFSWSRKTKKQAEKGVLSYLDASKIRVATYRPFTKQWLYFDSLLNEYPCSWPAYQPTGNSKNLIILLSGVGSKKGFSALMTEGIGDFQTLFNSQSFPLYWYEKRDAKKNELGLDLEEREGDYVRHHAITDFALKQFRTVYNDPKITREAIFYYVYGVLHSPEYRQRFESDLTKDLPRVPFAKSFWVFSKAGEALADLHLHYENAVPCALVQEEGEGSLKVQKLRFADKVKKDTIIYNKEISLTHIPAEAYEYQVNGKSAIEWVVERYSVSVDLNGKGEGSGIVNDPNLWCEEHNDPRYIIDLIKRIVTVSLETVKIVKGLPPLQEIN